MEKYRKHVVNQYTDELKCTTPYGGARC